MLKQPDKHKSVSPIKGDVKRKYLTFGSVPGVFSAATVAVSGGGGSRGYLTTPEELREIRVKAQRGIEPCLPSPCLRESSMAMVCALRPSYLPREVARGASLPVLWKQVGLCQSPLLSPHWERALCTGGRATHRRVAGCDQLWGARKQSLPGPHLSDEIPSQVFYASGDGWGSSGQYDSGIHLRKTALADSNHPFSPWHRFGVVVGERKDGSASLQGSQNPDSDLLSLA